MIHTAKEIRKKFDILIDHEVSSYLAKKIEKAINDARIEAIRECYEVVEMKQGADCDKGQIDRQLILDLIDQIK